VVRVDGGDGVRASGWRPYPFQFRIDLIRASAARPNGMIFIYLKNVL
jgi:hypothetical protein